MFKKVNQQLLTEAFFTDFSTTFQPGQDQDQVGGPGDVSSKAQGSNHGHQRQAFAKGSNSLIDSFFKHEHIFSHFSNSLNAKRTNSSNKILVGVSFSRTLEKLEFSKSWTTQKLNEFLVIKKQRETF